MLKCSFRGFGSFRLLFDLSSKHQRPMIWICLCTCILLLVFICPLIAWADGAYTTDSFDVRIDVQEDNSFNVHESIHVNFALPSHGIFRYIPYNQNIRIDQLDVEGWRYESSVQNSNKVVRIGDPNRMLTGPQIYELSYRCRVYEDGVSLYDSFYWNVMSPGGWDTSIGSMSIVINMPESFDGSNVRVMRGQAASENTEGMSVRVEGNTIFAENIGPLNQGEGVTVEILLPDGYFTNTMSKTPMLAAVAGILVLPALLVFLLWFCFGRDPKVVETVEFYPPEGMTPAEVGYVLDGLPEKKDMISMIIYFADKGYLSIDEESGKRKKMILVKNSNLPDSEGTYAHTLFRGLFSEGDRVLLTDLGQDFARHYMVSIGQLKSYFSYEKENRIFTISSLRVRLFSILLAAVPLVSLLAFCAIWQGGNWMDLLDNPFAYVALAGFILWVNSYDSKQTMSKKSGTALRILGSILLFIGYSIVAYLGIQILEMVYIPVIAIASSFVTFVFAVLMKKRTKRGAELLGKVLGFKSFIRTAELEKIKELVEENPSYFYNILPYAYVFGLTNKWMKNFEGIEMSPPKWHSSGYGGQNAFNIIAFSRSFDRFTSAMHTNIDLPKGSSSAGSFGSGGSFGGGSVGGGFGGGGGGRW